MTDFMKPRMAYVLEFDRRGGVTGGTPTQRQSIRDWLAKAIVFGNNLDLTMRALARAVKVHTPYVNIQFDPGFHAFAGWYSVHFNPFYDGEYLQAMFGHELGHVIGLNLLNDRTEEFAEGFKFWTSDGSPTNHPTWERLKEAVSG